MIFTVLFSRYIERKKPRSSVFRPPSILLTLPFSARIKFEIICFSSLFSIRVVGNVDTFDSIGAAQRLHGPAEGGDLLTLA